MRDAHQSLLATRVRTYDLAGIADAYAHNCAGLFSLEMWGGATFDTSMRFLQGVALAAARAACARGFRTFCSRCCCERRARWDTRTIPTTSSRECVREAAAAGIDVFRIFDALNWTPNMRVAMEAVQQDRRHLRGGHLLHRATSSTRSGPKYNLKYYVNLAKELK